MNRNIKNSVAAAVVLMAMAPAAHAGVQVDTNSLTNILVQKGVLTPAEAKQVSKNNDGKLKLEATLFFSAKSDKTTPTTGLSTTTNGFSVDRVYMTAKYNFNSDWMARVTTDMGHESTLGKQQNIYLKYAYVEGKLAGDAAVLRVGQSHTPWIDKEEGLWQHRYIENTMIDKYGFESSADLGLGLKGKVNMFNYFITETNGTGYGIGNGAQTGNKGLDFAARLGVDPIPGMTVDVMYLDGYHNTKKTVAGVASDGRKSTLWQAMVTYGNHKQWRVGANYLHNEDKAAGTSTMPNHGGNITSGFNGTAMAVGDKLKSNAYDAWGYYNFPGTSFGGFGRYEHVTNQADQAGVASGKEKIVHYVLGAEYHAVKGVDFSLVWDNAKADNVGGTAGSTLKDSRIGLYSQVNF